MPALKQWIQKTGGKKSDRMHSERKKRQTAQKQRSSMDRIIWLLSLL